VTAVPRPTTKLTDEQRRLLEVAVEAAREKMRAQDRVNELDEIQWQRALEARRAGVPDELLCDETGLSRATLNRKYGPRREGDA
jgi:hypothetical protein